MLKQSLFENPAPISHAILLVCDLWTPAIVWHCFTVVNFSLSVQAYTWCRLSTWSLSIKLLCFLLVSCLLRSIINVLQYNQLWQTEVEEVCDVTCYTLGLWSLNSCHRVTYFMNTWSIVQCSLMMSVLFWVFVTSLLRLYCGWRHLTLS